MFHVRDLPDLPQAQLAVEAARVKKHCARTCAPLSRGEKSPRRRPPRALARRTRAVRSVRVRADLCEPTTRGCGRYCVFKSPLQCFTDRGWGVGGPVYSQTENALLFMSVTCPTFHWLRSPLKLLAPRNTARAHAYVAAQPRREKPTTPCAH